MKKIMPLLFLLILLHTSHAYGSEPHIKSTHLVNNQTNQLIIQFNRDTTLHNKETILQSIHAKEIETTENGRIMLASLRKGTPMKEAIASLKEWKQVESSSPNYKVRTSYTPTDSGYTKQWYAKKINMESAWDLSKGSPGITVAVVDAGLQVNHPDLVGHITMPYNAVTSTKTLPANDHGTHVAGIIGATLNNKGTAGIAPEVKIMPINVFDGEEADIFSIVEGIDYAVQSGADIINLSLTMEDYTEVLDYSIQNAWKKGIVIVAAAGNEDTETEQYPAALDHVLGISATTKQDKKADFSNYGPYIDLAAPGVDIYSTIPWSSYDVMSGTSMSAPIVSGLSALVLSKNPFLTPSEVTNILQTSSKDLGAIGRDDMYGYGRVDAKAALTMTPSPISKLTKSSATLIEDGTNALSLSFKAKKGTEISVSIHDATTNKLMRKLVTNEPADGTVFSTNWDGKLDDGSYAPTGKVKITVTLSDKKHHVSKSTYVSIKDEVKPELGFTLRSSSYSPRMGAPLTIPFTLNKSTQLTAIIYDSEGKKVSTLLKAKTFKGGRNTLTWDGRDHSHKQVKDGTYSLKVSLTDSEKRKGKKKTYPIVIDTKAPKATMTDSSAVLFLTGTSTVSATIAINENLTSTVTIINSKGKTIKKLESSQAYTKGNHTVTWDGKQSNKAFVEEGTYQFHCVLIDAAGNTRTLKSAPFTVLDKRKKG